MDDAKWNFLPVSLMIQGQTCLVLGQGPEAERKTALLRKAGGEVESFDAVEDLVAQLSRACLVVACSTDASANQTVSEACRQNRIPVNVYERPELSSFIFPSIIDRHPMLVSISSSGDSPVLTRLLRNQLESVIPHGLGRLAKLAGDLKAQVRARLPHLNQRRRFWEGVLQGQIADLVFAGRDQEARDSILDRLENQAAPDAQGEVYLVGAGPGDPDLLSFRALRLMRQADVVLYDRLVSEPILNLIRQDAERIYVGKARADHAVPQDEINQLLVDLALQNKRVLRLKGGDPFIFGRGGEEIDKLAENGIPFQVVPGITAAAGCAAYAGIPLTHRDFSQSVRFVTGHLKNNTADLRWADLVQPQQTLVFYMGLVGLPGICEQLQAHGLPADMPVAVVSRGTQPDQRVLTGTLSSIADEVQRVQLPGPTIIIVGEVVSLRDKLNWMK